MIVGPRQIVLGLVVDTNKMTLGITNKYIKKLQVLLDLCDPNKRFFKVNNMQKLVEKLARLGEGAEWILKLMLHLYTSLAYALKSNTKLLEKSSSGFRDLIKQILTKNYSGKIFDHLNRNNHNYLVNRTMWDELNFIAHALNPDSGIKFDTPITHLIPRTPTASIVGNSLLLACGGYSITLKFWWHLSFPENVVKQTLLHLKDNSDESFISINCLEYFTIIVNYCASFIVFSTRKVNNDPHPVVFCITDNTSVLNWTLHTSKKSSIGRALDRFFCDLLIGLNVGINAKWISTVKNKVADKISRLKKLTTTDSKSSSTHHTYNYANLQQEHKELKACIFFQPSHKLVSLLLGILLTGKCPDLNLILILKPQDLGKLCA